MQQKHILYLMQQPPYLNYEVFEAFDALLVAAAFEQHVSLLFTGSGVQQLLAQQAPDGQRSVAKMLRSLEAYDITNVYADANAMTAHGLSLAECEIAPTLVNGEQIAALINRQDLVLNG